jgi:two-component system, sensor histidine kinase and response regulator
LGIRHRQARKLAEHTDELTHSQKELRETERFFRSVLELAPDGLMVVDATGVIRLANARICHPSV